MLAMRLEQLVASRTLPDCVLNNLVAHERMLAHARSLHDSTVRCFTVLSMQLSQLLTWGDAP